MKPDAQLPRCADGFINQIARLALREQVHLVNARRTSGQQQLSQPDFRGNVHGFRGYVLPDSIEKRQPIEQFGILNLRQSTGKRLK